MSKPTDDEIEAAAARLADVIINCEVYEALGLLGLSEDSVVRATKYANEQRAKRKERKQSFSGHPMLERYIVDED